MSYDHRLRNHFVGVVFYCFVRYMLRSGRQIPAGRCHATTRTYNKACATAYLLLCVACLLGRRRLGSGVGWNRVLPHGCCESLAIRAQCVRLPYFATTPAFFFFSDERNISKKTRGGNKDDAVLFLKTHAGIKRQFIMWVPLELHRTEVNAWRRYVGWPRTFLVNTL